MGLQGTCRERSQGTGNLETEEFVRGEHHSGRGQQLHGKGNNEPEVVFKAG